jgi:large subunit ribosomal protein L2
MKFAKINPITSGLRHQSNIKKTLLSKNTRILRTLIKGFSRCSGRCSRTGRITAWHKGGGAKNIFRKIELSNKGYNSIVLTHLHDPFRCAFTSLNFDLERLSFFRVVSIGKLTPGALVTCGTFTHQLKLGYRTLLKNIPVGSIVNTLSVKNRRMNQYIRSGGSFGQLIQMNLALAKVKLPSKQLINVCVTSFASVGVISNSKHNFVCLGKAGKNRLLHKRPVVRGIAMNPVDHPHGGRTNGGRPCEQEFCIWLIKKLA